MSKQRGMWISSKNGMSVSKHKIRHSVYRRDKTDHITFTYILSFSFFFQKYKLYISIEVLNFTYALILYNSSKLFFIFQDTEKLTDF